MNSHSSTPVSDASPKIHDQEDWETRPYALTRLNSLDCWDYTIELECLQGPQDLQLAAELGKTLLERNKELECGLKQHQNIIEDQAQEIEYLTKQTVALREVNDSRLRCYEQLEVSISDLERANHRLSVDNAADKKQIKSLCQTIDNLEAKCDELTRDLDERSKLLEQERRRNERIQQQQEKNAEKEIVRLRKAVMSPDDSCQDGDNTNRAMPSYQSENLSSVFQRQLSGNKSTDVTDSSGTVGSENGAEANEELLKLIAALEDAKKMYMNEKERCSELEEELKSMSNENRALQTRLSVNANDEMKSIHEELSILEEVRQGQTCSRCLRHADDVQMMQSEDVSVIGTEDDDDRSLISLLNSTETQNMYHSEVTFKLGGKDSPGLSESIINPYRDLVAKYEALLEVRRMPMHNSQRHQQQQPSQQQHQQPTPQIMSLHDELNNSGDFSSLNTKFSGDDSGKDEKASHLNENNGVKKTNSGAIRKQARFTPTEFSEADTVSSGFSDETSNKATQTDERSGSFLCTIADGEDCKFSIYDDASPIDSRFRNRPEYRELFREIFTVLKKAAENKDEGEKLPLLDDNEPAAVKVPPVTPATEEMPTDFPDESETQSVISVQSEHSVAMSERITRTERKKLKQQQKQADKELRENKPPIGVACIDGRILTPYKREPLEYLSVAVGVKKKKKARRNLDRSDSPVAVPSPPRVFLSSGNKRGRHLKPYTESGQSPSASNSSTIQDWNGTSMTIYNRSFQSTSSSSGSQNKSMDSNGDMINFRPSSSALHDLHKLKSLELSYAEVLRRADLHNNSQQKQHSNNQTHHGHHRKRK